MNATLTLDADVAVLLERARKEIGGSLEKLGNELLRRTLAADPDIEDVLMQEYGFIEASPPEAAQSSMQPPPVLEAQIDQLYDEIRDLVAGSAETPDVEVEIERKREQLQALQAEEAAAWRQRAEARRHLKPGEGHRLFARAASLLDL